MTPRLDGDCLAKARKILRRLCDNGLLSMSVPVRESDEDMILSAVIEGAAAALSASKQGWMPISTAPKDGTRFLAVCGTGRIRLVRWDDPGWDRFPIGDEPGGIWPDAPTHWHELPPAPAAQPQGARND